jgi:hypothetical protein
MAFSQSAYDTSSNPLAAYGANVFGPWFGNMDGLLP